MIRKSDELPRMPAALILAHKDKAFAVFKNFSVFRFEDYQTIGFSGQLCEFTLYNTKDTDDVNQRLVRALDIAAKNSSLIGAPYVLIDTKALEYQLVRREEEWFLR